MKMMKKTEFDEMQMQLRHKIGYQSFMLLCLLIMLDNILYGMGIIWINHPTNTFILLLVSLTFFIVRALWRDALVGPKDTSKKFSFRVFLFVLLSIIIAGIVAVAAKVNFNITADGGGMLLSVCCFLMWAIIGIVYLIKQLAKSHANES
jgi:hypothetical protein